MDTIAENQNQNVLVPRLLMISSDGHLQPEAGLFHSKMQGFMSMQQKQGDWGRVEARSRRKYSGEW